jgi:hypothetical protein
MVNLDDGDAVMDVSRVVIEDDPGINDVETAAGEPEADEET